MKAKTNLSTPRGNQMMAPSDSRGKISWSFCLTTTSFIIFVAIFYVAGGYSSMRRQLARPSFQSLIEQPARQVQDLSPIAVASPPPSKKHTSSHRSSNSRPRKENRKAPKILDKVDAKAKSAEKNGADVPFAIGRKAQCDMFAGKWVYDEPSRPLYAEKECPYVLQQMRCQTFGRPDKGYERWRWQPHGCSLPSFNAALMLERLQGKRILFVGDSLMHSQVQSILCLLRPAVPEGFKYHTLHDSSLSVYSAWAYNTTIEFYWAPFLLESTCDDPKVHDRRTVRILRQGSLGKHARHWKGADVLVFNSFIWWRTTGAKMKILREPMKWDMKDTRNISEYMKYVKETNTVAAYRQAIEDMVRWVEKNMDPGKTRVFFTSMSPTHSAAKEWGGDRDGNCYNETIPIEDPTYWGSGSSKSMMRVDREVLGKSKVPITVINITQLSEYRKDAHISIYKKPKKNLSSEEQANPELNADCIHWCLPGLQDTWNELLYAELFFPYRN